MVFAMRASHVPQGRGYKDALRRSDTLAATLAPRQSDRMFDLDGIDHVALAVQDVERSAHWYLEVLGFERRHEGMWKGVPTFIGKGVTALALFPAREGAGASTSGREGITMLHLAFRANRREFLAAQRDLTQRGIPFAFQDHEISHSIYFRDPDGHELEITTYEVD
jgi:catechol 2,3-dioxygenase-like lactoylglutathione lyase family enzyme